jgi:hypothetical protein
MSNRTVISIALLLLGLSPALAEHRPSMDGGVATVPFATSTTLFNGHVPANGFFVRIFFLQAQNQNGYGGPNGLVCFINDSGLAALGSGFYLVPDEGGSSASFETPREYSPIGPVSIWCSPQLGMSSAYTIYVSSRGW